MNTDKQAILLKKTTALLVGTHDFRQLARQVTDLVVKELNDQNLVGAAIFRVHENENSLYAYAYANKYHKLIDTLLPAKFSQFNISLSRTDNLVVKSVVANQIQHSKDVADFSRGVVPDVISRKIQKIMKAEMFVALPIRLKSGKAAGAVLLALSDIKLDGEQLVLFETLASQLGLAFSNILEYERLLAKYENLAGRFASAEDDKPSVKFTLRITPKENEKLESLSRERKRTKAEIIRDFLETV